MNEFEVVTKTINTVMERYIGQSDDWYTLRALAEELDRELAKLPYHLKCSIDKTGDSEYTLNIGETN